MVASKLSHWLALALCTSLPCVLGCGLAARGQNVSGVQAYQQGNYALAMHRFQSAQQSDPRNADGYYNQAALLHKNGLQTRNSVELSQAESLYNTALLYEPNHVDAHRGLAVLLTETGRIDSANTLLRNWAATSPNNADARVELARLSEEIGDQRNAETYLLDALRIDGGNWRAHAALGRQRELQGRYAEAIQNYQRAATINPTQPQLAVKIQELSTRMATNALPSTPSPTNVGTVGTLPNTGSTGFNWSNPPAPNTILANPAAAIGARTPVVPNPNVRY
ncbi:tetratricopeptide repeat protein [Anatilimnocola floriformis]|uniref:tetratricopeptide repeat protein n=1 Tax=Anatilimnocola floriformis TaxID=2948575 RepID=UPI0020C36598|nr:tetratricopeptide repeat protein [Anatilimnocola floriformis]